MTKKLSEPECFLLLSNRKRLLLLRILNESSEACAVSLSLRELAERIAERTYEFPSAEEISGIRLGLYHNHIPRLEEANVVFYDRDDDTVEVGPNFDTLRPFLDPIIEKNTIQYDT